MPTQPSKTNKPTYTMLVGVPGSGKSTIVKSLEKQYKNIGLAYTIVCPDTIRKKICGSEMDQSKNPEVFQIAHKQIQEALRKKINVIYDATNISHKIRTQELEVIKNISCYKKAIVVDNTLENCLNRNKQRPESHQVPDYVIFGMYARKSNPTKEEGFDEIEHIDNSLDKNMEKTHMPSTEHYNEFITDASNSLLEAYKRQGSKAQELEQHYQNRHKEEYKNEDQKLFFKAVQQARTDGLTQYIINSCKDKNFGLTNILGTEITDDRLKAMVDKAIQTTKGGIKKLASEPDLLKESLKEIFNTMPNYNYRGVFLDRRAIERTFEKQGISLPVIPEDWSQTIHSHITTSINSMDIDLSQKPTYEDIGTQIDVQINGYAYKPDKGLALDAEVIGCPSHTILTEYIASTTKVPAHITIATAPGIKNEEMGKIFDEPNVQIVKFNEPIVMRGSYGGFDRESQQPDILNQIEKAFMEVSNEVLDSCQEQPPYLEAIKLANTKDIGDRTIYLKSIIDQRTEGPHNAGSSFEAGKSAREIVDAFVSLPYVETTEQNRNAGTITNNKRSFEIQLAGNQGVILAKDLPENVKVYAVDGHGNGSLEFGIGGIEKIPVQTTTLLTVSFDEKANNCDLLLTAFPGEVRSPSKLEDKNIKEGCFLDKNDVIELAGEDAVIKFLPPEKIIDLEEKHIINYGGQVNSFIEQGAIDNTEHNNQEPDKNITKTNEPIL